MKLSAIASRLGVSISTVSRALRHADGVDAATRSRVLAEAARIGYRAASRQGASGRTRTLLALSHDSVGGGHLGLLSGMSQAAISMNLSIITHQVNGEALDSILNPRLQPPALRSGQVEGILLLENWPAEIARDLRQWHPVVSLMDEYEGIDFIDVDFAAGAQGLFRVMEPRGKLGFLGFGPDRTPPLREVAAWHGFLADVARTKREPLIVDWKPRQNPSSSIAEAFQRGVTRWICADDAGAALLKGSAQSAGGNLAERLEVAICAAMHPQTARVTGWEIPTEDLGFAAVRRLLRRLEFPLEARRSILLAPRIVPHPASQEADQTF